MSTLPTGFAHLIAAFTPLFSARVFQSMQRLLTGAILATGKRTITAMLRIMGLEQQPHFQTYHRVFNRAVWSALAASRILLSLLVQAFAPHGPLVFGLDDTIERRWGARIAARGIYRDPVRSSQSHFVKVSGLRWLCLMLLVPIPWAARVWALPFLTALCPSKRYHEKQGKRHKTLTEWARQMVKQVKRWLPQRQIVIVADSSFSALEFLDASRGHATIITRLRMDAGLYAPAPARPPGKRGRSPKKGERLPTLQAILAAEQTPWHTLTVPFWYGESNRQVEVTSGPAHWHSHARPAVPLRWVLIRDPLGHFATQALLCTDQQATPAWILDCFVRRWQVEVTCEQARAHLGVETQRQWADKAIARTTPCLFGLYSIVTLLAQHLFAQAPFPLRNTAWYAKQLPTFSDAMAAVRCYLWNHEYFSMSPKNAEMVQIPRPLLERFVDALCYAA